jgi:hypothetical protein
MIALIAAKRTMAMTPPAGTSSLILHGQSADGRTNHARNESRPVHGERSVSAVGEGVSARPNAVSQTIPMVR